MKNSIAIFDKMVLERKATWWEMYLPAGDVIFGTAKTDMLGYQDGDFNHYQDFVNILHPDDKELAMQAMSNHLEGANEYYEVLYRIKTKDGDYIRFLDIGRMIENDPEKKTVTGLVFKIEDENDVDKINNLVKSGETDLIGLIARART